MRRQRTAAPDRFVMLDDVGARARRRGRRIRRGEPGERRRREGGFGAAGWPGRSGRGQHRARVALLGLDRQPAQ